MAYQNKWGEKGLCRIFTDKVSGDDILDANLALHGDSRFDDISYIINDFSQIVDFQLSGMDIVKVATIDNVAALSKARLKIAIVATTDAVLDWVNLYCEKMVESPYECEIFSNLDCAYQWVSKSI